jgi:hypothetical protein
LKPTDAEARHNLAVAIDRIKRPPPPKKDDKKNSRDKQDDKKSEGKPPPSGGGGGQDQKPQSEPKTRPQDQLTKDEAERILRAVDEREKQAQKQAQEGRGRQATGKPPAAEDW